MRARKKRRKKIMVNIMVCVIAICAVAVGVIIFARVANPLLNPPLVSPPLNTPTPTEDKKAQPDELLQQYTAYINEGRYEDMYALLAKQAQIITPMEDFVSKNKGIYEGIEVKNLAIEITEITETTEMTEMTETTETKEQTIISYDTYMDTLAGEVTFSNKAYFTMTEEKEYRLIWSSHLIFPNLNSDNKVKINTLKSERGSILDRNGEMLAGKGVASSVGFVPGKMNEDRAADIEKAAKLLGITAESINKKLGASYVKDDMFIPIRTIPKGLDELEGLLLEINGIKITDTAVRYYPFGEKASHLTGYIQNVTAEDLERFNGQGYNADSMIGKAGLEKDFEERLRGLDGYEIVIVDKEGQAKETLATKYPRDGETIMLTVDIWIQNDLYDQFCEDKSAAVAMNPKTGEILALVSTPTFDSNDFVLGLSETEWEALNEDENKPLYNRFKAALSPGSGFKPIIGAIGLTTGKINPDDDYGYSGRSWQKDASWGGYKVTTLTEYNGATLENALIYSDNIYFAKAALNIGGDTLAQQLLNIGFDEAIPFEISLYWSSFSNDNTFSNEIQLADSGYGQGQILINPIHIACIYSSFMNDGNMIKPYLLYEGNNAPEYWKEQIFTKEAAHIIKEDLIQVVERLAGGAAKVEGLTLAGKTGTAEIKMSKDDTDGTELGWFNVFTGDEDIEKPLLIITMVEDVKDRGGSGYLIPKIKKIFEDNW
ncbi:MAG: penicillin-binding transpeptidase domain-containing protein [Clostridiales bacterium]|jgi:penicillin-binding protein|nr:penicillin-binding transpeptidase domain-containing protein [Clostridiales bacterium]